MSSVRKAAVVALLAGAAGFWILPSWMRSHPASVASLALGTDDAFAISGLEPRENQVGGGALRWTRPDAVFSFESAGPGPVDVDLEVRGHRTELTLSVNGARVGTLAPGQGHFASRIQLSGPSMLFGIDTEGFEASGRTLGTQVLSLGVRPAEAASPGPGGVPSRLWLAAGGLLAVSLLSQLILGLSPLISVLPPSAFLLMVLPGGLWRAPWLVECAILLALAAMATAVLVRPGSSGGGGRFALQAALFLAVTVHGVLAPSPLVIQGDVQMHGNKLVEVARGNRFPTSRTDHRPPFEIPYGVSFYGTLAPFVSFSDTPVKLVREGAAFFSVLSVLLLGWSLSRVSAGLAAGAVLLWTVAPVNLRTMGFGNLSNVFAQAIFLLLLVLPGLLPKGLMRVAFLALLVTLSATAHLSSFIVLFVLLLVSFFVPEDRYGPLFKPLLAGVVLAGAYFATFLPMIVRQVPRLLAERGGSSGVFDPWRLPVQFLDGAGWPLVVLVALALVSGRARDLLAAGRSLALAAVVLALAALVSPVEVRYLLAVVPLMAVLGGSVFAENDLRAFPPQGLTSVVHLPGLRRLTSGKVILASATALAAVALVQGVGVLLDFIPLSR